MAATLISRTLTSSLSLLRRTPPLSSPLTRRFSNRNPKLVNFSLPDSDSDENSTPPPKQFDKRKLPPPYDPFKKSPATEEDPKNLQEVFHKIREDGLFDSAAKMFDGLSKDGLTHEALELFRRINEKGEMPDVVAHTAVIEAYANAGQTKEAHKVYLRMLASGILPNAYTYAVIIKALAKDNKMLQYAKKYVAEMMGKNMRPNAITCVSVIDALLKEGKAEEEATRQLVAKIKEKGFLPEEKAVREVLKDKRGPVSRSVMNILYDK